MESLTQLQRSVESAKVEFEGAQKTAETKAEMLQSRVVQLERECAALQRSGDDAGAGHSAKASCPGPPALSVVSAAELSNAQECNRRLLVEVREARAVRDQASIELEALRADVVDVWRSREQDRRDYANLKRQLQDKMAQVAAVQQDMECKQRQIDELEQKSENATESARVSWAAYIETEALTRSLAVARRKAEEALTLKEWRLQDAIAKLSDSRPHSGGGLGVLSRSTTATGDSRQMQFKLPSKIRSLGRGSAWAGSDADSTTAGESAAEGLP